MVFADRFFKCHEAYDRKERKREGKTAATPEEARQGDPAETA